MSDTQDKIGAGDVVQHRSGGVRMTVERVLRDGNAECAWFVGTMLHRGLFPVTALRFIER